MQSQWKDAYPGIVGKVAEALSVAAGRSPEQGSYSGIYAAISPEIVEKGWNGAYLSDPVSIVRPGLLQDPPRARYDDK